MGTVKKREEFPPHKSISMGTVFNIYGKLRKFNKLHGFLFLLIVIGFVIEHGTDLNETFVLPMVNLSTKSSTSVPAFDLNKQNKQRLVTIHILFGIKNGWTSGSVR